MKSTRLPRISRWPDVIDGMICEKGVFIFIIVLSMASVSSLAMKNYLIGNVRNAIDFWFMIFTLCSVLTQDYHETNYIH